MSWVVGGTIGLVGGWYLRNKYKDEIARFLADKS